MAIDTNIALTTYESVKTQLGLTDDTQQSFIESQINVVSQKIACYCNRNFKTQEYTEKYRGDDTLELVLNQYPITDLSNLYIDDTELTDLSDIDIEANEGMLYYEDIFNSNGYVCGISRHKGLRFKNIKVVYTAGYILPDQIDRNLPYDLEQACINEVINAYTMKGKSDAQRLKSWSLDKAKKEFAVGDLNKVFDKKSGLLKSTSSLLDTCYRRYVI